MRAKRHLPIPEQGAWLASVLTGHYRYYAVPGNSHALRAFRHAVKRLWFHSLRRRSQRHRLPWARMSRLEARWLPQPRILHPRPTDRFDARTLNRSPVR
jgi:RNA-directed DNA polymerase